MLVCVCKKITNGGRLYEEYLDTDDLSDEDYAEFRKLWDSDKIVQAKIFLSQHI